MIYGVSLWQILVGVLVIALLVNYKAVLRVIAVLKAKMTEGSEKLEESQAEALYKQKIQEAIDKLRSSKEALIRAKTIVTGIERKIAQGKSEIVELEKSIEVNLEEGNRTRAATKATELQSVQETLARNEELLKKAQDSYQTSLDNVKYAQQQIVEEKQKAERLGNRLEMAKMEAELGDITRSLSSDDSPLNEVSRYKDALDRKIDSYEARGVVANDLDGEAQERRKEQEAIRAKEANDILAKFEKRKAEKAASAT